MEIKPGRYKARAIPGSEEYGESNNGTLQLTLTLNVPELERTLRTYLYFTQASAPFSIERLRALGWQGDDYSDLEGIDRNEVEIEVRNDVYGGKTQTRVEIVTRPQGKKAKSVDRAAFAAKVAALTSRKESEEEEEPHEEEDDGEDEEDGLA